MKKTLKKFFPSKIKENIKDDLGVPSLRWSLKNLKQMGYNPQVVYDIGAYEGLWAQDFLSVFPETTIILFEGQEKKRPILERLAKDNHNIHYEIALLGAIEKPVHFVEQETGSCIDLSAQDKQPNKTLQCLDNIINENNYPLPDFLKLDVQGFELEVLKGGRSALANAMFCLLEVSLLDLGGNGPLMLDVMNYMDDHSFQPYDISQFMRRPFDKALHQIDLLFIRKNSQWIANKVW